ncbi:MAG TPA: DUF92 domain-containing protein [Thermoanaerobaculia bacterium]|nr:DUF92 domain-containing protein [Thermoanaerobaculia bacterium]
MSDAALPHSVNELLRKTIHIAFGFAAISLAYLTWQIAAIVAAVFVLGNWLVLHRVVGRRVSRSARGYDAGIVLYPLTVLIGILIFRHQIEIAGLMWTMLAFGDGFAGLIGKTLGGPRLPWNRDKSWSGFAAFIVAGTIGSYPIYVALQNGRTWLPSIVVVAATAVVAAIAESLVTNIDDNLVVPFATAVAAFILVAPEPPRFLIGDCGMCGPTWTWLIVNAVLAVIGYLAKSVDLSGMLGGLVLGAIILICGGLPLYLALLMFFVIGTAATKLGYKRKAQEGLAQEKSGRRGFSHAFANTGVAALCAMAYAANHGTLLANDMLILIWFAAVAALATACADTVGSEIGQLLGRRAFLPLTLHSVPRGTEGAVSIEGTVAGALGALCVSWVGVAGFIVPMLSPAQYVGAIARVIVHREFVPAIVFVTACAVAGSYVESIIGNWNRRQEKPIPNGVLNYVNTLIGAALVIGIGPFVVSS